MKNELSNMAKLFTMFSLMLLMISCSDNDNISDAYGNFEATEIIVSAEGQGIVGIIDTTQLILKKQQAIAQKRAIAVQNQNITAQVEVQEQQKNILQTEQKRVENLLKDGAATQKQMDDINGQIKVVEKSIDAIKSQNPAVFNNIEALDKQIAQLEDMLYKCRIVNPIDGVVLEKYMEARELAAPGKPLYKIADMSKLDLRVYVSGDQLPKIKLGQEVEVLIDKDKDQNTKLQGKVSWISPKAEFTPKIIQTKKERVNLVYAVKINVVNDGSLKIGMPGEVNFK